MAKKKTRIGEIVGLDAYTDAVLWCRENNATIKEVEKDKDGNRQFEICAKEEYVPTKDDIKRQRQMRYADEADPLKYDYEEALARGEDNADELKAQWLAKKDEIREELPYPKEV